MSKVTVMFTGTQISSDSQGNENSAASYKLSKQENGKTR